MRLTPRASPLHLSRMLNGQPALATHPAEADLSPLRDRLRAHIFAARASDGGWGPIPARQSDVESSAWVLVGAARVSELADLRDSARSWLLSRQQHDGSWLYRVGPTIATWPTHAALFALTSDASTRAIEAISRAKNWLSNEHSATPTRWQRVAGRLRAMIPGSSSSNAEPAVVLDASLDGFGWAHETFAWVEPTSLAMLAMSMSSTVRTAQRTAVTAGEDALASRMQIALAMLRDRQSPDGGWNFGNKRVLGVDLPGYPDTTAWALLGIAAAIRHGADAEALAPVLRAAFAQLAAPESPTISPLPTSLELLARLALPSDDLSRASARELTLRAQLVASVSTALDGAAQGYPLLETRTAVFALLALSSVNLLADGLKPETERVP